MKIRVHPYLAEFLGTLGLVVSATSAGTLASLGESISPLGDGLFSGLAVLGMILLFGSASGAHINPAVSVAMVRAGKLPKAQLPGYLIAQFGGAVVASGIMRLVFTDADEALLRASLAMATWRVAVKRPLKAPKIVESPPPQATFKGKSVRIDRYRCL